VKRRWLLTDRRRLVGLVAAMAVVVTTVSATVAQSDRSDAGLWVAGDIHTHTFLTDGNKPEVDVAAYAFSFGLDFFANSEHGGSGARDPYGAPWAGGPVWRWLSLRDYSYPIVANLRKLYPTRSIIQGVEWNVPAGEHASVGIVGTANEPTAVSNFEYIFDKSDADTSQAGLLPKTNTNHAAAVAGAAWLQANYPRSSYLVLNHPSRALKYSVSDIRDFNNAAPTVAIGLEALPGHQKEPLRGGYSYTFPDPAVQATARTYGGADYMLARVGGLMDSLWGEGRSFWAFTNSDFHDNTADADFWPGEYAKSYTYVAANSNGDIVNGMRSGNTFAVQGDLINALDFQARAGDAEATMGETLRVEKNQGVTITIRFQTPRASACQAYGAAAPQVDHVDLIAGDVTGKALPGTPAYASATNSSTAVAARFSRSQMEREDGWYTVTYRVPKADHAQYFRLRGTNQGLNVPNQTDAQGNPLIDTLSGTNDAAAACSDLWFYSNPIFVATK
jgi:hypothetical protein